MEVDTHPVTGIKSEPGTSGTCSMSKLGLCEVCGFHEAKYSCPRCEVKTCSLKCNKIHKLELECNGERDRTKFVPINKFSNLDLSSDYRLLEEISRSLELSKKKFGPRGNRIIPDFLFKLQKAASVRRVKLKFLPFTFARHKNNTTQLFFKTNTINWHIEWVFINADNLRITDQRVPETTKLTTVLEKYFNLQNEISDKLQYYQAVGLSGVRLFLKAEQKTGKKFYELDPSRTVAECLQKKLIIEHPTIHVVLKDHGSGYNVIDSDDEDNPPEEKRVKTGAEVVDSIIKSGEVDESMYESLKNLLFVSEYSDEELSSNE